MTNKYVRVSITTYSVKYISNMNVLPLVLIIIIKNIYNSMVIKSKKKKFPKHLNHLNDKKKCLKNIHTYIRYVTKHKFKLTV